MPTVHDAIDASIEEADSARKRVAKIKSNQVRGIDEIATLKATSQTWFHTHRPVIARDAPSLDLTDADACFTAILDATSKHAAKSTYLESLQSAKIALVALRKAALVAPLTTTDELAPDFSPLVGNPQMREILVRRWNECDKCVKSNAHLAAIVMMGGLLEALFVARANKMSDKTALTSAKTAPKDKATGKTTNYQDWMLDSYIKVGFELKWITESAKDVADRLKEYRNFVHPAKELRYGVTLGLNDSSIFWQVTKALTRQLLLSA
jgi:hypothetical protein